MKKNSIEKKLENVQRVDLITLLRQFKKEGLKNFIVLRKSNFNEILSDYKRVLKENEYMHNELDKQQTTINKYAKENEEYSKQLDLDYVDKNYIPKQKVKDEIEELKGKLEDISKRREKSKTKEEETVLWCLEIRTDERIKTLQELL